MSVAKKLLKLKERVEEAKEKLAKLSGQKIEILNRLKEEHGVKDEKEAKNLQKKLKESVEKLGDELEEAVTAIEEELEEMEEE